MENRTQLPRRRGGQPPEWLVHDEPTPCAYLPGRIATLPLRVPTRSLSPEELSRRLADGDRRQGILLYRPQCDPCHACEPIRIDVSRFRPSPSERRVLRRAGASVQISIQPPAATPERVDLFNRHKLGRGLAVGDDLLDLESYAQFLVSSCADTFEIDYRHGDRLFAVAVTDRAADSLSAVYCYFDPTYARLSPGTLSILTQIELCRDWDLRYLYLGLYVAECAAMSYKARFGPHERRIDGRWQPFDRIVA